MNLIDQLYRQAKFSEETFGPGDRTKSVIAHIKKELVEIEENPTDIFEWIDLILLAFDGVRRKGYTPEEIVSAMALKQSIVEKRTWPDYWQNVPDGEPIEHIRPNDQPRKIGYVRTNFIPIYNAIGYELSYTSSVQQFKDWITLKHWAIDNNLRLVWYGEETTYTPNELKPIGKIFASSELS